MRNKREGSVWQIPKCKLEFHETEKPVELIEKIIVKSSDEGMVVFDPFMGSGTTGIACIKTKRQFIGIEMIEKNYQTAKKRVGDFYKSFSHGTLFGAGK